MSKTIKGVVTVRVRQCSCGIEWETEERASRGTIRQVYGVIRSPIDPGVIRAVMERDEHRCRYCGIGGVKLGVDHVVPLAAPIPPERTREEETAFRNSAENLVACCPKCNEQKGPRLNGKRMGHGYSAPQGTPNSHPPRPGAASPRLSGRGVGGALPEGSNPEQISDSNPQSSLLSVPRAPARSRRRAAPEPSAEFNRFWARWPRRVKKGAAVLAWNEATADSRDVQRIEAIHRVLDWEVDEFMRREPNARPHAATWLNGKGWEDEQPAPAIRPARPALVPFKEQERAAREERDLDARADLLLGVRR